MPHPIRLTSVEVEHSDNQNFVSGLKPRTRTVTRCPSLRPLEGETVTLCTVSKTCVVEVVGDRPVHAARGVGPLSHPLRHAHPGHSGLRICSRLSDK